MRILTNAIWLSFCRITADLSGFVLFAAVSRAFGPTGTGEYSYAFALASFVAFAAGAGIDEFGTRQYARSTSNERGRLWTDIISTQYAQLLLSAVVFGFVAMAGSQHARVSVLLELSGLLVAQYVARTFFVPSMAAQAMAKPAVIELSCRFTAIVIALVLVVAGGVSLPVGLIGFPIMGIVIVVLAARNARAHGVTLRPHFRYRRMMDTARLTAPFTVAELLSQFYARTDLLLIAYLLGNASVGLYSTDIKFVEFGIIPMFLLGTAAYPSLSRAAAFDPVEFSHSAKEFIRLVMFLGGWLAVGVACVVPVVITPIFGSSFHPAVSFLPWFAALALLKGAEAALYRLMYAVRRTTAYMVAILTGTTLTIVLSFALVPVLGLLGAVIATITSVGAVVCVCAWNMRAVIPTAVLWGAAVRMMLALAATGAAVYGVEALGARPWVVAIAASGLYPVLGVVAGLVPHPTRSSLLRRHAIATDIPI